jgi:signal transduction histidine kinase
MRHALINLLDNSCKFTPKHGSIEIRGYSISTAEMHEAGVAGRAAGYRIDVIDSGPSIPFERAENIFDEDAAYTGSTDRAGAGLGLAMCRMIISAHNGRIWATPGGPGAKFSFVLPYVQSGDSY